MVKIEPYCAKGVFNPPAYSQAVKVTGAQAILFLSGQVAYDEKGGPAHRGDIVGQAREVFRAIKEQVEAGGGKLANVVKLTTYLTDIRHRGDIVPVRESSSGRSCRPPRWSRSRRSHTRIG